MMEVKRLSGLQKDVLSLYRSLLRSAKLKDEAGLSGNLCNFVKKEFRLRASLVNKNDFRAIEHNLRHGHKQKKLIDMPGFRFATSVKADDGNPRTK
mmetsp:Transcript_24661/g.35397  ORF Transcript_24661/g.35397 Transcript_24661/m.35397 type:complete len:96 (-) Transcript_24661:324-611(-)